MASFAARAREDALSDSPVATGLPAPQVRWWPVRMNAAQDPRDGAQRRGYSGRAERTPCRGSRVGCVLVKVLAGGTPAPTNKNALSDFFRQGVLRGSFFRIMAVVSDLE